MQHSAASPESYDSPDEDPQPPDPSPLYIKVQRQLDLQQEFFSGPGLIRLEREERRRPADVLDELKYCDQFLLAELLTTGQPESLSDFDTYTNIRFLLSYRTWQLRLENISGIARSLAYDIDRPGHVQIRDESIDEESRIEFTFASDTVEIDTTNIDRLHTEVSNFVYWFAASCPEARKQQLRVNRERKVVAARELQANGTPQVSRRLGRFSFKSWSANG